MSDFGLTFALLYYIIPAAIIFWFVRWVRKLTWSNKRRLAWEQRSPEEKRKDKGAVDLPRALAAACRGAALE
jgi:hypothetical protein